MAHHPKLHWCRLVGDTDPGVLALQGHWRLADAAGIWHELQDLALPSELTIDGDALESLDSVGALMVLRALHVAGIEVDRVTWRGFAADHARILDGVRQRMSHRDAESGHRLRDWPRLALMRVGRSVMAVTDLMLGHLNFLGLTLSGFAQLLWQPRRLRLKELTVQFEQVCLSAIPVVALVTLLIGVTVTYLLGLQAEQYGANIFVVDGVGIGVAREFSPIIVATIIAGRSGAAFTAQLGAMRLTEEIDAIRTLGLSPMQVLVIPRVLALMLALPLLVFVGDVMGVMGTLLIADPVLGLTPATVLNRLNTAVDISHFWVGLVKGPVFAVFIAIIGCRMGMTVERDSRAVGLATTSTVVQSIVSVILLDAAFAIVLQALGI